MTTIVAYYSKFGNTKMVAEAIRDVMSSAGQVRFVSIDTMQASDFKEADLVFIGCPTHATTIPQQIRPIFHRLPQDMLKDIPFASFDTSFKMPAFLARFTAAKKLAKRCQKLGGQSIVPPETFFVTKTQGPLADGEIERAKTWASGIMTLRNSKSQIPNSK